MKLNLDACCINRPFDDQSQDRVRVEAEAVLLIIQRRMEQEWMWYGSDVLVYELEQIPDADRWQKVRRLSGYIQILVDLNIGITNRASENERSIDEFKGNQGNRGSFYSIIPFLSELTFLCLQTSSATCGFFLALRLAIAN